MSLLERTAWETIGDGWRQLYGSFRAQGLSIEWHEFSSAVAIDWGASFHTDSVELCLNLEGRGEVEAGGATLRLGPAMGALYVCGLDSLRAVRFARERHRFVTIEMSHAWLLRVLAGHELQVALVLKETLFGRPPRSGVGVAVPLGMIHQTIASSFCHPPVGVAGRGLWFEAKVLELLADLAFQPSDEMFCSRQKRIICDRISRTKEILVARLADPPALEELAREVGVSPFYLSRTFSRETEMTISQFLRRTRIERAAEFLRGGTHNVSEAAFAVGYSSLGHFSKSFCEVMGVCPTLYPQARNIGRQTSDSP